jgi:hypothetical protein
MRAILASMLLALLALSAVAQTPRVYGRLTHRMETGKVKNLAKDLLTFSPLAGGPDITVKVGADTRLTKDNKPAHLTDIKAGNYVRVMFPIGEGTVTAQSITLLDEKDIPARK